MKDLLIKLFEEIDPNKELITQEKRDELTSIFEEKVKELKEKALKEAMEQVDDEHYELLQKVIEKIENNHAELLEQVVEKFKSEAEEIAEAVLEEAEEESLEPIYEQIDEYLDTYLDEIVPKEKIDESVEFVRIKNLFENLKEIIAAYNVSVDDEIKEAVLDGKELLEQKEKELNEAVYEKVKIKKELDELKFNTLLEQKIESFDPALKAYVKNYVDGTSYEELEEKINEAVEAYEDSEKENIRNSNPQSNIENLNEGNEFNGVQNNELTVQYYTEMLKKMKRYIK